MTHELLQAPRELQHAATEAERSRSSEYQMEQPTEKELHNKPSRITVAETWSTEVDSHERLGSDLISCHPITASAASLLWEESLMNFSIQRGRDCFKKLSLKHIGVHAEDIILNINKHISD